MILVFPCGTGVFVLKSTSHPRLPSPRMDRGQCLILSAIPRCCSICRLVFLWEHHSCGLCQQHHRRHLVLRRVFTFPRPSVLKDLGDGFHNRPSRPTPLLLLPPQRPNRSVWQCSRLSFKQLVSRVCIRLDQPSLELADLLIQFHARFHSNLPLLVRITSRRSSASLTGCRSVCICIGTNVNHDVGWV